MRNRTNPVLSDSDKPSVRALFDDEVPVVRVDVCGVWNQRLVPELKQLCNLFDLLIICFDCEIRFR